MVLLSFDTEEFDVPRESGVEWNTLTEGMEVSKYGTNCILDVLKERGVRATFYCTANFAEHAPEVMKRIVNEGHEVACHGCDHWEPKETDFEQSKIRVEKVLKDLGLKQTETYGYRQPRMFAVNEKEIARMGYHYNSSLNPAFIPGKYMHLTTPRTWFMQDGVMQIPASVSPILRLPLFWLGLHNYPEWFYHMLVRRVLKHDGYFNTYFHPWEFYELKEHPEFKTLWIVRNHSGRQMAERLGRLIDVLKAEKHEFITYNEFYLRKIKTV